MGVWERSAEALAGAGSGQITGRPGAARLVAEEVAPGTLFVEGFSNGVALETGAGLLIVDGATIVGARGFFDAVRAWSPAPLKTAVYTHGHADHVFGVGPFDEEADAGGRPRPEVIAHAAVVERFDVYRLTAGYNGIINHRQFQIPPVWPTGYRYPDRTYHDSLTLDLAGERFELHHYRGETDDGTWVWAPARRTVCCGDLFIWLAPNAGNPQKRLRYAREWALALRQILELEVEILLPGHGLPIRGRDTIRTVLGETAQWLMSLHDQTVALMNEGRRLDEIVELVRPPAELAGRPYLQPAYDEPEFVVRNIWRRYGGWYDGNPARLKPPPDAQLAREVSELAGGRAALAARARAALAGDRAELAAQLIEWAAQAGPADPEVEAARGEIYTALAAASRSVMSRGIYASAARDSEGSV